MILIVENETAEAFMLSLILEAVNTLPNGTPVQSHVEASVGNAIAWLQQRPLGSVEVIVVDRGLQHGEDGLGLVPLLRTLPALHPAACVIVWSGMDDPDDIAAVQAAGADSFISKRRTSGWGFGRELCAIVDQLWQADQHGQPRPWLTLV